MEFIVVDAIVERKSSDSMESDGFWLDPDEIGVKASKIHVYAWISKAAPTALP